MCAVKLVVDKAEEKGNALFEVNPEGLDWLRGLPGPIHLIALYGDARIGKSTVGNTILSSVSPSSTSPFSTGDSTLPVTIGVDCAHVSGVGAGGDGEGGDEGVGIVVLDAEGADDEEKDDTERRSVEMLLYLLSMPGSTVVWVVENLNHAVLTRCAQVACLLSEAPQFAECMGGGLEFGAPADSKLPAEAMDGAESKHTEASPAPADSKLPAEAMDGAESKHTEASAESLEGFATRVCFRGRVVFALKGALLGDAAEHLEDWLREQGDSLDEARAVVRASLEVSALRFPTLCGDDDELRGLRDGTHTPACLRDAAHNILQALSPPATPEAIAKALEDTAAKVQAHGLGELGDTVRATRRHVRTRSAVHSATQAATTAIRDAMHRATTALLALDTTLQTQTHSSPVRLEAAMEALDAVTAEATEVLGSVRTELEALQATHTEALVASLPEASAGVTAAFEAALAAESQRGSAALERHVERVLSKVEEQREGLQRRAEEESAERRRTQLTKLAAQLHGALAPFPEVIRRSAYERDTTSSYWGDGHLRTRMTHCVNHLNSLQTSLRDAHRALAEPKAPLSSPTKALEALTALLPNLQRAIQMVQYERDTTSSYWGDPHLRHRATLSHNELTFLQDIIQNHIIPALQRMPKHE